MLNSEMLIRINNTIKIFLDNNGEISDEKIARTLAFLGIKSSSSTVQRDLTENIKRLYMQVNNSLELTDKQKENIEFIRRKRKENLSKAKQKGVINSYKKNEIIKNDDSKFNGCAPRKL